MEHDNNDISMQGIEQEDGINSRQQINQEENVHNRQRDTNPFHFNRDRVYIRRNLRRISGPTHELPPQRHDEPEGDKKFSNNSRLWMGRLPKTIDEEVIRRLFEPFGEVDDIRVDRERKIAFLRLDYRINAIRAREKLNGMKYNGVTLNIKFSSSGETLKVRNLSPFVTNELLKTSFDVFGKVERAVIATDEFGRPTGEGIVEFNRKFDAKVALERCTSQLFFITASPRPVIVEPFNVSYENGFKEVDLVKKHHGFYNERQYGPRFAEPGTFDYIYAEKWRRIYENYDRKIELLTNELNEKEQELLGEIEVSQYDYDTELLKQQVREREGAIAFTRARQQNLFPHGQMSSSFYEYINDYGREADGYNNYREYDGYYDSTDHGRENVAQTNTKSQESNMDESTATQEKKSYVYGEKGSFGKGWTKSK